LNPARAFNEEMNEVIRGRDFDSIEAMNAFARAYCDRTNAEPKADFAGLSAEQVHLLINLEKGTGSQEREEGVKPTAGNGVLSSECASRRRFDPFFILDKFPFL